MSERLGNIYSSPGEPRPSAILRLQECRRNICPKVAGYRSKEVNVL